MRGVDVPLDAEEGGREGRDEVVEEVEVRVEGGVVRVFLEITQGDIVSVLASRIEGPEQAYRLDLVEPPDAEGYAGEAVDVEDELGQGPSDKDCEQPIEPGDLVEEGEVGEDGRAELEVEQVDERGEWEDGFERECGRHG